MAWAALSCWISRGGALLAQGATPEHRAEGGRGTEVSRQLSAWCCVWRCSVSCRAEKWKVTLSRCVWGGSWPAWGRARGQTRNDCDGAASALWHFTLGALISFQCLCHSDCHTTWNVSESGSEQWAGSDRESWWNWSFRASVLRVHWGSKSTDTKLCMHRTLKQVVSEVGHAEQKSWFF